MTDPIKEAIAYFRQQNTKRADELADAIEVQAADAARYRWVREGDNDEHVLRTYDGAPFPVMDPDRTGPAYMLRNEELDAAIDALLDEHAQADSDA